MSAQEYSPDSVSVTRLLRTTLSGMKVTAREALKPEFTEHYPEQHPALPWGTKGQLHVDINDCIACFKCAVACPTDCIRIDVVRTTPGALPDTSDGHKRMFEVLRFDIDMAQCCYCGLCTGRSSYVPPEQKNDPVALAAADRVAACPTDCINFYPSYENGCEDPAGMLYHFAALSFDAATQRWHSTAPDKRRSTHPDSAKTTHSRRTGSDRDERAQTPQAPVPLVEHR